MNQITLHPNVYSTGPDTGLVSLLERVWVKEHTPGDGELFIISGFANYNGGVRFYDVIKNHVASGGNAVAVLSGSTSARLSSKQVVEELLGCGVEVNIVNRKRLLHAKCYGVANSSGESLIVTSGNFTGPGMSQNGEMSVLLDNATTASTGFSWRNMLGSLFSQRWNFYKPELSDLTTPAWKLLYDEQATGIVLDETEEITMVLTLSHADTARINASPGTNASKGSQYFWLSKDCYSFFPPLTIRNARGTKPTYSCIINMNYISLGVTSPIRVTFEAGNNLDFRLGTGELRGTSTADDGDLAVISRVGENDYQLRIVRQGSSDFGILIPYAVNLIGHRGKQYGFLPNQELEKLIGIRL